jgi:carbonic anhydrase/acetyltransferase-like protein (isoleucine patch superfamily)
MAIRTPAAIHSTSGSRAFVDASAWSRASDVEIGANSSVWPLVVIRGDMHINIGAQQHFQDGSVLAHYPRRALQPLRLPLNIGDDVTIAHNVTLHGAAASVIRVPDRYGAASSWTVR